MPLLVLWTFFDESKTNFRRVPPLIPHVDLMPLHVDLWTFFDESKAELVGPLNDSRRKRDPTTCCNWTFSLKASFSDWLFIVLIANYRRNIYQFSIFLRPNLLRVKRLRVNRGFIRLYKNYGTSKSLRVNREFELTVFELTRFYCIGKM